MTTRYVGSGGNNTWDGLSWSTRKLTLTGVEDTPVVAGDTIYVGASTYREQLTLDVAGSAGLPITYIGDITGEHTDGIGGCVRITGSDNDTTNIRGYCIYDSGIHYRTFRGFVIDLGSTMNAFIGATNIIYEDCFFGDSFGTALYFLNTCTNITIRRCIFQTSTQVSGSNGISFSASGQINACNNVVEDCIFINSGYYAIYNNYYGGLIIKNCWIEGSYYGVYQGSGSGSYPMYVYDSVIHGNRLGLYSGVTGYLIEDYNNVCGNYTDRTSVSTGSNSISSAVLTEQKKLIQGFDFPYSPYNPRRASSHYRKAGTSSATEDIYGITRPATESKKSWGPVQHQGGVVSSQYKYEGSYALWLEDAGSAQFYIPTSGSNTFSVYVYRQSNYAGTNPQMVIKRPGHSDVTVTDTGSAESWNLLQSFLYFPDEPRLTFIELVSSNTATSGSNGCWFDFVNVS